MKDDRRSQNRVNIKLTAKWNGLSGIHEARVEDISLGGCFVCTTSRVEEDEIITLSLKMPSGEWLELRGEVASAQPRIGFGLRFTSLTDEEKFALRELIG